MEEKRGRIQGKSIIIRDKSRGRSKLRRDLRCYYCDKLDHMKKNCWKLKKDKRKDNNDRDDNNEKITQDNLMIKANCWKKVFDSIMQFLLGN